MNKRNEGLAGVVAGSTKISSVDAEHQGLSYRGYTIEDLTSKSSFEEVAFLLLNNKLPTKAELDDFKKTLISSQRIPQEIIAILEQLPATSSPMDVLRTACSAMGMIEPELQSSRQVSVATRLIPLLCSALFYWFNFSNNHTKIETHTGQDTISGHILELFYQKKPDLEKVKAFDTSLILYAEHEFNASTFAARVCVATGTDFYGPITAAIATLAGPLHGGANEAAMYLIRKFNSPDDAEQGVLKMLAEKQLIMGFGHRVYTTNDPRTAIIKKIANNFEDSEDVKLFAIASRIEEVMWREKQIFANLDFYSSLVYNHLRFPAKLFTPLFVLSRLSGWSAHIIEQRENNKLIRPDAEYLGPEVKVYRSIEERNG